MIADKTLKNFHQRLYDWYQTYGRRDLPWRNTDDPYAIYISEIMLQQTQVETVKTRFYTPFLSRFPTLTSLSEASLEDVLSLWQGLGYYRRAGHLHAAAKQAKGVMPNDVAGLVALPGIGKNTAHAVAAFGYHLPVAVMEANVKRVVCRIFALSNPNEAELWEGAEALLDIRHPYDYNQAMMDIGAMVCTIKSPLCSECPASIICKGKENPLAYPAAKAKKITPIRHKHIIIYEDIAGKFAATPRATRFLHGLYHFHEQENKPGRAAKKIGEVRQVYSHFTLQAIVYLEQVSHSQKNHYYTYEELQALPMSMAEKKILQILQTHAKPAI